MVALLIGESKHPGSYQAKFTDKELFVGRGNDHMQIVRLNCIALFLASILSAQTPPVYVVLFTHIEDNTPVGTLGSVESRQQYSLLRTRLIALANLTRSYNIQWSLQPDWKILLAAFQYEDAGTMQTTNGKNFLRYLKEDLQVVIDPHSHENGGYNYTDVAHLLDSLGVGMTTVIGGHIWDPSLPQFQNWDRFRVPVRGIRYPWAQWRGDILMGSGTPNHVNDPTISGVWRPKDRFQYFIDDPDGNICSIGQFNGRVGDAEELTTLYSKGIVASQYMLTSSIHIKPATITQANGIVAIEDSILKPLVALRTNGQVVLTDFTSLVAEWKSKFEAKAFLYDAKKPVAIDNFYSGLVPFQVELQQNYPNPFNPKTVISYVIPARGEVHLTVYDLLGREIAVLVDETQKAGSHSVVFRKAGEMDASGIFFYRLITGGTLLTKKMMLIQ